MGDIAIHVDKLGKRYRIGQATEHNDDQKTILRTVTSPFRYLASTLREPTQEEILWALKDVSFEVKHGEVVGIIGSNGAGKSTLLKILSRITEPTRGEAHVCGRIGSLLEVGTGFNPELTGRENIYLSGAILGMKKAEIDRKFDEIVAFSGVEKFIHTPFKRYSSGMGVRLAFSVAAHLDPEILLVDEVLAVGDAEFQKKCLDKMQNVTRFGRTVLFVSHNMVALQSLCQRVIWLDKGRVVKEGETAQLISEYLKVNASSLTEQVWDDMETAPGNDTVRLHRIRIRPQNGSPSDPLTMEMPIGIEVEFWNLGPDPSIDIVLNVYTEQQIMAFTTYTSGEPAWAGRSALAGLYRSVCLIPGNLLNSGLHRISLTVIQEESIIHQLGDALSFEVFDFGKREAAWYEKFPGAVHPKLEWDTEYVNGVHIR